MKVLISSGFLSFSLIGSMAFANNPIIQLDREDFGMQGPSRVKLTAPEMYNIDRLDGSSWHVYQTPCLDTEKKIDEYISTMDFQKKAFEQVGEGTYYPEAPGYYPQKVGRIMKNTTFEVAKILQPIAMQMGIRIGGDIILSQVGPWFADKAGNVAANAASKANAFWTQYDWSGQADKGVRAAAYATAKGEALRDLGTAAYYVETYGYPIARTAYKATCAVGNMAYEAGKKTVSSLTKFYNWGKSWFGGKESLQSTAATA